ncbi:DUF7260 family protein, partial [Natronolimnohabitans innermongolicus]
MTVTTRIHRARERVDAERTQTDETVAALERFARALEGIEPASPPRTAASTGNATAVSTSVVDARAAPSRSPDRCRAVRDAFDETVREATPSAARPPTLAEHVRDELGPDLALALSPESDRRFTPDVKACLLYTS